MKSKLYHWILLVIATVSVSSVVLAQSSSYAGQQTRKIKSLSESDTEGLLEGRGMGLAKAAELNGYPGPMHVLELSSELKLTASQTQVVQASFDRMKASAQRLGAEIIKQEAALDAAFAERKINEAALGKATASIGKLQAELRATHLKAHLETTEILTKEQVALYVKLRGYGQ